jgi:hypothetical protein
MPLVVDPADARGVGSAVEILHRQLLGPLEERFVRRPPSAFFRR